MTWHPDIPLEYRNQIVTGDAQELLQQLPSNSVDVLLTDPPYYQPSFTYPGNRSSGAYRRTLADMSLFDWYYRKYFNQIDRILRPTGCAYIFCDSNSYPIFYITMFPFFRQIRVLVWRKAGAVLGLTWRHQHELIAFGLRKDFKSIPTGDSDVLDFSAVSTNDRWHIAEKPVPLLIKIINKHSPVIVCDTFAGSGSTVVAAKMCECDFVAFEIDPDTAAIARERVANTQPPLFVPQPQQIIMPMAEND